MNLDVNIFMKQGRFFLTTEFRCFDPALGIFGPSGCGKSTLFRALSGLVRPYGGYINLDGETLYDSAQRIFVPPHRRGIGLVFQDARLFPHWSVEQNLRAGEQAAPATGDASYGFDDVVDLLGIHGLIARPVGQLSGGEKQRVAIGRTLLSRPRLLLMDEPVTGLDSSLKMQILPFLSELRRELNIPIVLISHDLGEILQLTDRLLLMRDGQVVGNDRLPKLVQDPKTLSELSGADLTNILPARVSRHNPECGVTELSLPGEGAMDAELNTEMPPGRKLHVGVAANQVALSVEKVPGISMRNQLPGILRRIVHTADRSLCCLETAAGELFAEIAPATEREMGLREGMKIHALFKSRAIQSLGSF